jgi:DNA polymerase-4
MHFDIDSFHANVACSRNPSLWGHPVAVCGDEKLRKGIVTSCNMLAKLYGVSAGLSNNEARSKCPGLIMEPLQPELYAEYSDDVFGEAAQYSDYIEKCGDDEGYVGLKGIARDLYDARLIAQEFQAKVEETTGLTLSCGISDNKVFAKIGSDLRKPDSCVVITRENYQDIVWKLPTDKLLFINAKMKKYLECMKIYTIGDIANERVDKLEYIFKKWGTYMYKYAHGNVYSPVKHKDYVRPNKSISSSMTTIRDMTTIDDVRRVIYAKCEILASILRKHQTKCRTVKIAIREYDLKYCERQGKLIMPSFVTGHIAERAVELFKTRYNFTRPLRSIGVGACDFIPENASVQTDLFYDIAEYERQERLERCVDRIRDIHGFYKCNRAIIFEDRALTYTPPEYERSGYFIGVHNNLAK